MAGLPAHNSSGNFFQKHSQEQIVWQFKVNVIKLAIQNCTISSFFSDK